MTGQISTSSWTMPISMCLLGHIAFPGEDTYWSGKEMGRLGELTHIANQVGHTDARDHFLGAIKDELEDWFDAGDGTDKQFFYNSDWGTLQGYPASFHSETQINDHQFHYGYFVQAAAHDRGIRS